eukprot:278078-Pelagomonas_calceolata.AAC.2
MAAAQVLEGVAGFLGLANCFRKFVEHFSTVVAPLTALCGQTGKGNTRVKRPAKSLIGTT